MYKIISSPIANRHAYGSEVTPDSTGATSTLTLPTPTESQTREKQAGPHHSPQYRLTRQFPHQPETPSVSGGNHVARANPTLTLLSRTSLNDELKKSITDLIKSSGPKLFQHRPQELKKAIDLLRPLSKSTQLTPPDKLTLIDASEQLQVVREKTLGRYPDADALTLQLDQFIGSGTELHSAVNQLAKHFERAATVTSFESFMKKNHPAMVTTDSHGKTTLTAQGAQNYTPLQQRFKMETQSRYVIALPNERCAALSDDVVKIVGDGYSRYQNALRKPDNSIPTKRRLLECAQIISQLASATPEAVKKERIATVFPGGLTDPSELVQGHTYKEEGFVFIGGERESDSGHLMQIKMSKGYPVDARRYYGHSLNSEKKLQWISLPGAEFRFDGIKNQEFRPIYKFSQVDRHA
ncbi:hypothetical protein IQK56_16115 [Pseudomonas sp. MAFF 301449]|uniref:Uncharacterized protein n=1 Tax=Pseudomonas cyclaminis TaxID=2781239 RepID=A0ABR9SUI5_9PSED|nr:hypothetical protein [Pseudomonas cyclaminis]MBE8592336.1 hypothetical protein [Pseudomonas cyclaminis]MBE8600355.1 hypothetical protein [Pseudomonas cyclaminis]